MRRIIGILLLDELEAILHYIGLIWGKPSRYSATANTLTGQSPSEAKKNGMLPAILARAGWKPVNFECITYDGILKLFSMYEKIFVAGIRNDENEPYNTIRLCSSREVLIGSQISRSFISTSENELKALIAMQYSNCPELAIIYFDIRPEAVVFPMRLLGGSYTKPDEKEVLILPGMKMDIQLDTSPHYPYVGNDGKTAKYYKATVYGPDFSQFENVDAKKLWSIVLDSTKLEIVKKFYERISYSQEKITIPEEYDEWVTSYKTLMMYQLAQLWKRRAEFKI